jgi:hypothetical protein
MCVLVCVYTHTHTHTHTYIYIYIDTSLARAGIHALPRRFHPWGGPWTTVS